jgi:hypothetical protein
MVVCFVQFIQHKLRENRHAEASCLFVLAPPQMAEKLGKLTEEIDLYLLLFQHRRAVCSDRNLPGPALLASAAAGGVAVSTILDFIVWALNSGSSSKNTKQNAPGLGKVMGR